jgi:hypothetical protein
MGLLSIPGLLLVVAVLLQHTVDGYAINITADVRQTAAGDAWGIRISTGGDSCEEHAALYGQVQQDLLPFRLAGITKANYNASLQKCEPLPVCVAAAASSSSCSTAPTSTHKHASSLPLRCEREPNAFICCAIINGTLHLTTLPWRGPPLMQLQYGLGFLLVLYETSLRYRLPDVEFAIHSGGCHGWVGGLRAREGAGSKGRQAGWLVAGE